MLYNCGYIHVTASNSMFDRQLKVELIKTVIRIYTTRENIIEVKSDLHER